MPSQNHKHTPENKRTTWRAGFKHLLSLCNNPLSVIGIFIVAASFLLSIAFQMFALTGEGMNPYFDVMGYLVLPSALILGLIIVPVGALWKRHWLRKHAGQTIPRYVQIDMNDRPTRGAFLIFLFLSVFLILPGLAVSGYHGYIYTESTEFCAHVCHTVMQPQGTAHATSAHARVSCAECHIGEGADWFVKSKLSGTRQVFAVWFNTYHRPIDPAIQSLRPARDTCEECHWPTRFFGSELKEVAHYSPDQQNTRRKTRMLLKIGGADKSIGRVEGIHMHMLAAGEIEYVATDHFLQEIPWVRYTRNDGSTSIYRADGKPHDDPPPDGIRRTIDCMDCHNRGAHHFYSPQRAVNLQLEANHIDPSLPFIKREAVVALANDYDSESAAHQGIASHITSFYQTQYPQVAETRADDIQNAIDALREVYDRNFFPDMNVSWKTYPENVGHLMFPGCFRCHDGLHLDQQNTPISSDCTVCHTFLNEIPEQPGLFREAPFTHAMNLSGHENLRCDQCHTGGPLKLCRDCHDDLQGLRNWTDRPRFRRTNTD